MEKELNRSRFLENLMIGLCRFCLTYCIVVYFTSYFLNLRENNMILENVSDTYRTRGTEIYKRYTNFTIENITKVLKGFTGIGGTDYEFEIME